MSFSDPITLGINGGIYRSFPFDSVAYNGGSWMWRMCSSFVCGSCGQYFSCFLFLYFFISFFFSSASASFLFMCFDFAQSNYDLLCLLVAVKICFALCKQGVCGM